MKEAEDQSYNAMTLEMKGNAVEEAEIILEAVDKGDENSDDEFDRVEIAMSQYIGHTAAEHGLSVEPDDEDKNKWLLLGDDTQDLGWDPTNLPPGVHRAAPEGQSIIIAEGDPFDQETVASLELVSEVAESDTAEAISMVTAESAIFESVGEGTSTSKQPPTPPPPRRGTASKSAAGEPQSSISIKIGDEVDLTAAGPTEKPQVKAMPRIAKAKASPGTAEGEPRSKKQKEPTQEKIFWSNWVKTRKINTKVPAEEQCEWLEVEEMGHVPKVNMDRDYRLVAISKKMSYFLRGGAPFCGV